MVTRLTLALALLGALAACSGKSDPAPPPASSCPQDLPDSCPASAPSYAHDIAPIIEARCLHCHAAGGEASDRPLGSHADVSARRSSVLDQVYACKMPPAGEPQLSSDDRAKLLGWLVCGAPDN